MKKSKLFSVLAALVLMLSLCAVSVWADDAESTAPDAVETVSEAMDEIAKEDGDVEENVILTVGAAEDASDDAEEHSGFEPANFLKNLKYMGVGMFCIIIVIGVLIGVTVVLNKVFPAKNEE